MALFRRDKNKKEFSVPVLESAEARWKREEVIPFSAHRSEHIEGELALDVYLTGHTVVVRTAVAGVQPEDLQVAIHNDLLTIRGERKEEERVLVDQYVVQECHWGTFSRSVVLPVPVQSEGAEAVLRNGVLKIILQRAEPASLEVKVVGDE